MFSCVDVYRWVWVDSAVHSRHGTFTLLLQICIVFLRSQTYKSSRVRVLPQTNDVNKIEGR